MELQITTSHTTLEEVFNFTVTKEAHALNDVITINKAIERVKKTFESVNTSSKNL